MVVHDDLKRARALHEVIGGFLYNLGDGCYQVTQDPPLEHRTFKDMNELQTYLLKMANANFDETKVDWN